MRAIVFCTALFAAGALGATTIGVDDNTTHDGTVISAVAGQLTMADMHGRSRVFKVTATARISRNGVPASMEDFVPGDPIRVTVDARGVVVALSTIDIDKHTLALGPAGH